MTLPAKFFRCYWKAVTNGKGGVGKTTTAVTIASILGEKVKTLVVDTDPQARGCAAWWVERGKFPFDFSKEEDPKTLKKLRSVKGYELIVVDTPPSIHSDSLKAVTAAADYIILPTQPAPMDLAALIATVKDAIAPTKVSHRVLLTKVDPRSVGEALEAQQTLMEEGIPAFNSFIRSYKAHERAPLDGIPITKAKGKNAGIAASDYRKVIDELLREIEK